MKGLAIMFISSPCHHQCAVGSDGGAALSRLREGLLAASQGADGTGICMSNWCSIDFCVCVFLFC